MLLVESPVKEVEVQESTSFPETPPEMIRPALLAKFWKRFAMAVLGQSSSPAATAEPASSKTITARFRSPRGPQRM
jgi:hypothetical protein